MDYTVRTPSQLSPILRGFRKRKGFSQAELAQQLGVTQQAISELERAPQQVTLNRMMQVLAFLDVELVMKEKEAPASRKPKDGW